MKNIAQLFWLLSDETRLRILLLLAREELFVCQLMAVLGISQPLVSRNIALLWEAGLLEERRQGKMVFYHVKKDLHAAAAQVLQVLKKQLKDDPMIARDMQSLKDCKEFQKKTGACDMKTFLAFMEKQRAKRA